MRRMNFGTNLAYDLHPYITGGVPLPRIFFDKIKPAKFLQQIRSWFEMAGYAEFSLSISSERLDNN
jgi:hypothetical protein